MEFLPPSLYQKQFYVILWFTFCQNLLPQTVKTYLTGIRHIQITLGLPEPRAFSSLSHLRLVQTCVQRTFSHRALVSKKIRLPITPSILRKIQSHWSSHLSTNLDTRMLWAAVTMCFFGFFHSGEITIPSSAAYDSTTHLSWGDVTIDNSLSPKLLQVILKRSKTDQTGKGAKVFIGRTDGLLCPVTAILSYMATRGSDPGPFFQVYIRPKAN